MALVTRSGKGSGLTNDEIDANFAPLFTQAAHGLAVLDVVYHNGTGWAQAQADDAATVADGIVIAVPDVDTVRVLLIGGQVVTAAAHGFTPGAPLYLSQGTPGAMTATLPGSGIVQPLGRALGASEVLWRPGLAFSL